MSGDEGADAGAAEPQVWTRSYKDLCGYSTARRFRSPADAHHRVRAGPTSTSLP